MHMDQNWRCPFCEVLWPWPEDVVAALDGKPPEVVRWPIVPRSLAKIRCECRAEAVVRGRVNPETGIGASTFQANLDEKAVEHSALFRVSVRSVVYRRLTNRGERTAVLVEWVR